MRLRTKLIAYFIIIAALVPILGGAALDRVRSIDSSVQDLSGSAIPRVQLAERLNQIQRDQEMAALQYVTTGMQEDRDRYAALTTSFDQEIASLKKLDTSDRGKELLQRITGERAAFGQAGGQLLSSRDTLDRSLGNLGARYGEMVQELNKIRQRYVVSGGSPADISSVPVALRNQVNDLLLGTEGMLHQLSREMQLAELYTLSPAEQSKRDFETASALFASSLSVANTAGGAEDRAVLTRVQSLFKDFEGSARSMINAGDVATRARSSFPLASDHIGGMLNEYVAWQTEAMTQASASSTDAVNGARWLILGITLFGFGLAGLLGWFFANGITRPVVRLRNVADRVSLGELDDVEIEVKSNDEIADLATSFGRMVASVRYLMIKDEDDPDAASEADAVESTGTGAAIHHFRAVS